MAAETWMVTLPGLVLKSTDSRNPNIPMAEQKLSLPYGLNLADSIAKAALFNNNRRASRGIESLEPIS